MNQISDEELAGAAYAKASESTSDPHYNSDVRDKLTAIMNLSDDIVSIHVVEGLDPHLEVRLRDKHNAPLRRETAVLMGKLFDRPVVFLSKDSPLDSRVREQGQPPQHSYYRDDRREPKAFVREVVKRRAVVR